MAFSRALAIAAAVLGFGAAGCSSSGPRVPSKPPFPVGAEDCSTYCLVWVPPTYRDVPRVECCKPGRVENQSRCVAKVEFDEVCRPGRYEPKCTPCTTRTEAVVQASPGSDRWVPTKCADACGCNTGDCYRHERIPPTYKVCDKTVTEKGVEYCAYREPEYDVVARTKYCKECVEVYKPAEYRVVRDKELFQEGHWQWQKRDCAPVCAPAPRCAPAARKGFECCPPKD